MSSIRGFVENCRRILRLAKKPEGKEVRLTARVCAIGMLLIGVLAFFIHLVFIVIGFTP